MVGFVVWCVVCWWQWFAAGLIGGLYLICRLAVVLVLGCAGVWLVWVCVYIISGLLIVLFWVVCVV